MNAKKKARRKVAPKRARRPRKADLARKAARIGTFCKKRLAATHDRPR
jgi:hypothetical protein